MFCPIMRETEGERAGDLAGPDIPERAGSIHPSIPVLPRERPPVHPLAVSIHLLHAVEALGTGQEVGDAG